MKTKRKNVLVIADKKDMKFLDASAKSKNWNLIWNVTDYHHLHKQLHKIDSIIIENNIDFILYSRNDQVAKRISIGPIHKKLRVGYSSFSGIDDEFREKQTVICFSDFLRTGIDLNFDLQASHAITDYKIENNGQTFSVVFDVEQLGGVRFGLLRILNLLKKYEIKASFFVTNLIKTIYPNVLRIISSQGHEIGIHGKHHDFLSNYDVEKQVRQVGEMLKDFDEYSVAGANFIGRMDDITISALTVNKIKYFVHPFLYNYALLAFPKLPICPFRLKKEDGGIWVIPVSVETYGRSWYMIKAMLNSVISQTLTKHFKHVTILCHPFRDGNIRHMEVTENLLRYLVENRWRPVCLKGLSELLNSKQMGFNEVDGLEQLLKFGRKKLYLPKTKYDLKCIFSENSVRIYRKIRRNRTLF